VREPVSGVLVLPRRPLSNAVERYVTEERERHW
jgi:hypothetical protein